MVPNMGTTVPPRNGEIRRLYTTSVSQALREELGQSAQAAKTIMRWTGASERAAKYWMSGSRAPSGWQLVLLAKNSDAVLHKFLHLCCRDLYGVPLELDAAEVSLARATAIIRAVRGVSF